MGERPLHSELSDEQLAQRVAEQDVAAFTLLFDRYGRIVYALAAHTLGAGPATSGSPNQASIQAEDVVQEAFLRLWQRADQFDPARGSFRAWFLTIARHLVIDELKRSRHDRHPHDIQAIEETLLNTQEPSSSMVEQAWMRERVDALSRALAELPAEQRRAILLAYFGGWSQSEIARHLGWPLGTVKKRVRLALQKLRHRLMNWKETG